MRKFRIVHSAALQRQGSSASLAMLVGCAVLLALLPLAASAAERVALVVGNADYEHTTPLANPGNDASDMAAKLQGLGFEVVVAKDVGREALFDRVAEFADLSRGASVSLFYYAGHGLQVGGSNYLVPVDARLERELDVRARAVGLSDVLDSMGGEVRLVFLDACRNNPLAEPLARSMGLTRSAASSRGLAPVREAAETLIAYATGPNEVAADGEGRNSPFTAALLEHLDAPGVSINDVLTRVKHSVREWTGDRQRPWTLDSLSSIFEFLPSATATQPAPTLASRPLDATREMAVWEAVKDSGSADELEAYLSAYPGGVFAGVAAARLRPLVWEPIRNSTDPTPLRAYLDAYPNGHFRSAAIERIAALAKRAWEGVRETTDEDALKEFLQSYPQSAYASATQDRLWRLGWDKVAGSEDPIPLRAYLAAYPESAFAIAAQDSIKKLSRLEWEAVSRGSDANAVYSYLRRYPDSEFNAAARSRHAEFLAAPPDGFAVGQRFKDCQKCPEMVVVPAGSFLMGRQSGERGSLHPVTIARPFAVGAYEVTFAEWDACVSDRGCRRHRPGDQGWGRGNRPVIHVSWDNAQAYVKWLSRETRENYRLLSEPEWEYAARAGSTTKYSWGDEIGRNRANCDGCGSRWDDEKTAPVGRFGANGFGLYDTHGNVREWVEDCWNEGYAGAPGDGSAWRSGDCAKRVLRGGSWSNYPRYLRSASRDWLTTGLRNYSVGFRVARTLTP